MYQGQESHGKILTQALLPNYYMMDKHITRGDSVNDMSHEDMMSYLHVKRQFLSMMFICVHNGRIDGAENLEQAILKELCSGADESQLANREM